MNKVDTETYLIMTIWLTLRILPYKDAEEKLDEKGRIVVKEILTIN